MKQFIKGLTDVEGFLYGEIYNRSSEGIIITDANSNIVKVNPAFERITGFLSHEVIGKKPSILSSGLYDQTFYKKMWDVIKREGSWKGRILNRKRNGKIYLERLEIFSIGKGKEHYVAFISDITKLNDDETTVLLYEDVFENMSEGIIITDLDGKIIKVNPAFTQTTGYGPFDVIGKRPSVLSSGRHDRDFFIEMWATIHENGSWSGEIWNKRKNGEVFPEWLTINTVKSEHGYDRYYIGTFTDITQQKIPKNKLSQLSHYDALTGLPNRFLFQTELNQAFKESSLRSEMTAVLYVDINQFRFINESYGHSTGDQLLIKVANRLQSLLGKDILISRIGGAEFIILLKNIDGIHRIQFIVDKIELRFKNPFFFQRKEFQVQLTIGISVYPFDGKDVDVIINKSYSAVKQAKITNSPYKFYQGTMSEDTTRKLQLVNGLYKALERNEFFIMYQPQIDIRTRQVIGLEALLRWENKKLGLISPGEFIPLAEETGLIVPIGNWVIQEVGKQQRIWLDSGLKKIPIAVNLSPSHFKDKDFIHQVREWLKKSGQSADLLHIEITENVGMDNIDNVIDILQNLKEIGINVSIDDFGKGHSSLSYLKNLPVQTLKIDQSFIRNIHEDKYNASIVSAVMSIANGIGLKVIAEGVETVEELSYLKQLNCFVIQGYLFARPMPSKEIPSILKKQFII